MIDNIGMSISSSLKILHNYFSLYLSKKAMSSPNHNNIFVTFNNNHCYLRISAMTIGRSIDKRLTGSPVEMTT